MSQPYAARATTIEELRHLPLLLNTDQAASVGNVTPKHIRDMFHEGELQGVQLGRAIRINRDAFLAKLGMEV